MRSSKRSVLILKRAISGFREVKPLTAWRFHVDQDLNYPLGKSREGLVPSDRGGGVGGGGVGGGGVGGGGRGGRGGGGGGAAGETSAPAATGQTAAGQTAAGQPAEAG